MSFHVTTNHYFHVFTFYVYIYISFFKCVCDIMVDFILVIERKVHCERRLLTLI